MTTYSQGMILKAKQAFTMKVPGTRGRPVTVKVGDEFWVTTATYTNKTSANVERKGKGVISGGHKLDLPDLEALFEVVEE